MIDDILKYGRTFGEEEQKKRIAEVTAMAKEEYNNMVEQAKKDASRIEEESKMEINNLLEKGRSRIQKAVDYLLEQI